MSLLICTPVLPMRKRFFVGKSVNVSLYGENMV